ncbi:MAG: amidohydrolase, partial [Rhodobacterales bacterium]
GTLNQPGWTYAEVDIAHVADVRANGVVLNRQHWIEQLGRDVPAPIVQLG